MNTNDKETKMEHPNKDMIVAWASGEKLQFKHPLWDSWRDWDCDFTRFPDLLVRADGVHEWRVKPKVTFCEERGYKVGDRFLVAAGCDPDLFPPKENEWCSFSMIVELCRDDGSVTPLFAILEPSQHREAGRRTYVHLDNVKKIELFEKEK